jgi:hypothetical protein
MNKVQHLSEADQHTFSLQTTTESSPTSINTSRFPRQAAKHAFSGRSWIAYLAVAVLTAAYLFPFVRVLWHIGDEAISLEGARRVLQGDIPGRDFVEVVGPGAFWWPALAFKTFGSSIVTAHALLWLTGIVLGVLAFHLARRIGGSASFCAVLLTAVSIPIWPGYCYHWDSNFFALLAFAALVEWQRKRFTCILAVCGLLCAAATLIMQQKGCLLLCAALLSAVLIDRWSWRRSLLNLLAPYLTVLVCALTFYALHGAIRNLLWANFIWPSQRYLGIASTPYGYYFGKLWEETVHRIQVGFSVPLAQAIASFMMLPLAIVVGLPFILLVSVLIVRKRAFMPKLVPFWLCGAALWISEMQRPDIAHLMWGAPILIVLLSSLLRQSRWGRLLIGAGLAASVMFALLHLSVPMHAQAKIETRHGSLYAVNEDRALSFILKNTHPGDAVFIYPYYSLYNFLSDTQNPTRYSYLVYGWNTPDQLREVVDSLESKRVRYVLWDTVISGRNLARWFPAYRDPPWGQQPVEQYLDSHYRDIDIESGFRILERRGDK